MRVVKRFLMEEDPHEKKVQWIREKLDNDDADQFTEGWYEVEKEYEAYLASQSQGTKGEEPLAGYEDYWSVEGRSCFQIFNEAIYSSRKIIDLTVKNHQVGKNLFIMVYGSVVAATEAYLASRFINKVISSDVFLKKLVKIDPVFASLKFTIAEIYTKKEYMEKDVKEYLRHILFHNALNVKSIYSSVLGIDFGNDIKWLYNAISLRDHCIHRAGYDKEGNEIDLSKEEIQELIKNCVNIVNVIESALLKINNK